MCLGVPGQIVGIDEAQTGRATVSVAGVERVIDTGLVGDLRLGDWVVVHVGFALSIIDPREAQALLAMLEIEPATGRVVT